MKRYTLYYICKLSKLSKLNVYIVYATEDQTHNIPVEKVQYV